MDNYTEKELLKLKQKVDDAEQAVQQFKGRKDELLEQLKETFNCETIKEIKAKRKEIEKDLDKLQNKFDAKIKEINEKYNGTE